MKSAASENPKERLAEEVRSLVINAALDAIICTDTSGEITVWNKQAEKIFGWKQDEIIGSSLRDTIIPKRHHAQFENGLRDYLQSGKSSLLNQIFELTALNRTGEEFPVEFSITAVRQNGNEFFCAFIRDITERKKAEAGLRESENRLRTIIQTEPECIKLIGPEFELLEMNPAGLAMIQADSINQVIGHSVLGLVNPEHRDAFSDMVKDVFNGKNKTMIFEITGLKGAHRWIETHMVPMRDSDERIASALAVARDITEQKKYEESLRKAEERYRHIFENTLEGIFQSTPEGRFITANPAMAKMLGFDSPEEMISAITDIGSEVYADPKDRLRMKEFVEALGYANGFELKVRKKNSQMMWVRANIRAIHDTFGKLKYYEGTLEDITERRVAEEKLKQQFEEIRKTNYELDRFVYSVSHDLRAPLSSILGIINVAEMEKVSPVVQEYLEMVRSSVNRLDSFIKDILNYSRNARMDIRFVKINFHELLGETQNNLRLIEGAERLKIHVEVHDEFPFYSDAARMGIVFNNLFSNSIKYQDFQKESSYLNVNIRSTAANVVITLKDNGIGIPGDHLDKIFNMFYRASDVSKGSGLGLYIANESISKLGGTISVQSELGVYTSFEIVLPNTLPAT